MSASPDRALSISVSRPAEGSCVISLSGDLDIASSGEFGARLEDLTAAAPLDVVVELSGVEFVDSSGLNALVVGAREARRRGGSLVVAAPTPYVTRVFDLVRMGESVEIVGSVEEAFAMRATRKRAS